MPINGISVGKDILVAFADNNGNVVQNRVKMFSAQQKNSKRETVALDGVNRHLNIPIGWTGSFEMERISPIVDTYLYNLEQAYLNGQTIPLITITETITETNGSVSQFQYQNCVIELENAGEWKGDELITQKINFSAQLRVQLA